MFVRASSGNGGGANAVIVDVPQSETSASKVITVPTTFTPNYASIFKKVSGKSYQYGSYWLSAMTTNCMQIAGGTVYETPVGGNPTSAPVIKSVTSNEVQIQLGSNATGYDNNWKIVVTE